MKTLGVTGGIGAGKTTVCKILEKRGALIFYADVEAKRIQVEDGEARAEILRLFGPASYLPDGSLNRVFLAQQVFSDTSKMRLLNGTVHPRVRKALLDKKEYAKKAGYPLLVYEAALIFETGGEDVVDAVLVVDAPIFDRIQRVQARDGSTMEQVKSRIQNQLSSDEMRRRADFIIENKGNPVDLEEKVLLFWKQFVE
ncbi:MAG TPA: dephospho-CoA kinase [Rhodothermales bacterium]|nr:dephospho-CoA kinase [Bacteroidota bacterium]HRK73648.1 dephospho-CoA kinase [Rhodothermales bacterium]HRR09585.1 dephospho-CoA kinase [Rhodothermales bacterium]